MIEVSQEVVKRTYIKAEFGHIVRLHTLDHANVLSIDISLDRFLRSLSRWQKESILFWLSRIYRNNGVYLLTRNKNWKLIQVAIEDVRLSRINEPVNLVLSRPDVNWSLGRFAQFLDRYFVKNPNSDPQNMEEFREVHDVYYRTLIGIEDAGGILLLDGAHRAVSLCRAGQKLLSVYATEQI